LGVDPGLREVFVGVHFGELGQLSDEGSEVQERGHSREPELLRAVGITKLTARPKKNLFCGITAKNAEKNYFFILNWIDPLPLGMVVPNLQKNLTTFVAKIVNSK
jgi:hypothetical protein